MRQILDRDEAEDSLGRQMLKLGRDYNTCIYISISHNAISSNGQHPWIDAKSEMKEGKREKEQKASLRFVICVLNFEVNMCVILQKLKNLERPLGGTRSVDQ